MPINSANGKLRWLISCDESGIHGAPYYGFGTLWMKWQRRGDFAQLIQSLRDKYDYDYECKWSKVKSKSLPFYKELVERFFVHNWLSFHCLIVKKALVDKKYHGGDYDLARRKHFTKLLENKISRSMKKHPDREQTFRIWVDPIASHYEKADEAVEIITNHFINKKFTGRRPVEAVIERDSKETPSIQLCDLLLGSVMDAWNQEAQSTAKQELQQFIARHLGWNNLKTDTYHTSRKFNIWHFYDPTKGAPRIKTREVNLLYPLK